MNDRLEILSEEQLNAIKGVLHSLDVGLDNFDFACICNHIKCENNRFTNQIAGFEGRGKTDSLAVLNLVEDVWNHLSPEEKQQIADILKG